MRLCPAVVFRATATPGIRGACLAVCCASLQPSRPSPQLGFYALSNRGARSALGLSFPMSRQLDAECGPLRAGMPSERVGMFVPPLAQCSNSDTDAQVQPPPSRGPCVLRPVARGRGTDSLFAGCSHDQSVPTHAQVGEFIMLKGDTTSVTMPDCRNMSEYAGAEGAALAVSAVLAASRLHGNGTAPAQAC